MRVDMLTKVQTVLNEHGVSFMTGKTTRSGDTPYQYRIVVSDGYVGDSLKEIFSFYERVSVAVTSKGLELF